MCWLVFKAAAHKKPADHAVASQLHFAQSFLSCWEVLEITCGGIRAAPTAAARVQDGTYAALSAVAVWLLGCGSSCCHTISCLYAGSGGFVRAWQHLAMFTA
jgi:hypothetical protein